MDSGSGEVRSSDDPSTPRRRPRYRLPTTSGHASRWLLQRNEAVAKQAKQDFENAFKRVDAARAAMANSPIHGKATEEQMKALEDALRGEGDKAIKAPWHIDGCPPFSCSPFGLIICRRAHQRSESHIQPVCQHLFRQQL